MMLIAKKKAAPAIFGRRPLVDLTLPVRHGQKANSVPSNSVVIYAVMTFG